MPKLIEFKDVRLGYGRKTVIESIGFEIGEGDFLAVFGPNGSGKTTLLHGLMELIKPQKGSIERLGNSSFGYSMQRQNLDTLFPFSVYEVVMMARTKLIGPFRLPSVNDRKKVEDVLRITGCWSLREEPFYHLSGGQKQRALIARALCSEASILVLDEPTADLDRKVAREIMDLIKELQGQQDLTIIIVSHEINEIINYANKFLFLSKNVKQQIYPREQLTGELLSQVMELPVELLERGGKKTLVF
jgi:zinc transport system ATP-binding protein